MGYNESEGLVCRNPYNYPLVYPGSVPRLFTGPNGCPSPTDIMCERRASQCGWTGEDGNDFFATISNNVPFLGGFLVLVDYLPVADIRFNAQIGKRVQ